MLNTIKDDIDLKNALLEIGFIELNMKRIIKDRNMFLEYLRLDELVRKKIAQDHEVISYNNLPKNNIKEIEFKMLTKGFATLRELESNIEILTNMVRDYHKNLNLLK